MSQGNNPVISSEKSLARWLEELATDYLDTPHIFILVYGYDTFSFLPWCTFVLQDGKQYQLLAHSPAGMKGAAVLAGGQGTEG